MHGFYVLLLNCFWVYRCRWVSHFSLPMVNKSQGSSASTSLSESPMTLGSLPTNDVSPQADHSGSADGAEVEEQFLVKFQLQVLSLQDFIYCNGHRSIAHLHLFYHFCGSSEGDVAFAHSAHSFSYYQNVLVIFLNWLESFEFHLETANFGMRR